MAEKDLRLDKYLADMKIGTRSEVKIYIRKCRVAVNGAVVRDVGFKVSSRDTVTFDGRPVEYIGTEYIMLHKPAGVLTATRDGRQKTVLSLLPDCARRDLFPVGRLDKDTEGLLLITNDGALAHRLLSPKKHVDKVYYAKVQGRVLPAHAAQFAAGIRVDGEFTALPARLVILKSDEVSEVELTIQEGKFHQVKRMFAAVGMEVLYLKRTAMGPLRLDDTLAKGEYRSLTKQELAALMEFTKGRGPEGVSEKRESGEQGAVFKETSGVREPGEVFRGAYADFPAVMENISAVIFDLDGTLVDSMWMWEAIDIEYLGRFGIALPEGLQAQIEGMSFSETADYFKRRFPAITESIGEMKETWNRMAQEKYAREVFFKPGALGFLKYLREHGIRTGIATSNSAALVRTVLAALSAEAYFDEVHTACEVKAGKPAPDIYLYVAECLGVPPENCLVFEDIGKGIEAGKAAGMRVCAVQDAYSKKAEQEKRALADYFINDYRDFGFEEGVKEPEERISDER